MTILCFLQNLWVKDPAGWKEIFLQHPDRRVGIIRHLLLDYGCLTGRRIKACFGEDLVEQMIFEESSIEIAGDPKTVCPPNPEHIKACLEKYKPQLVVTFGNVARMAVEPIWTTWTVMNGDVTRISTDVLEVSSNGSRFISCPHPAARQADTVAKLSAAAKQIRGLAA